MLFDSEADHISIFFVAQVLAQTGGVDLNLGMKI